MVIGLLLYEGRAARRLNYYQNKGQRRIGLATTQTMNLEEYGRALSKVKAMAIVSPCRICNAPA